MTTAKLVKELRAAARLADERGRPEVAAKLRLAVAELLEEARLEEDAAMRAHLRSKQKPTKEGR